MYNPIDGVDTKQFEGLRLKRYTDSRGYATIGYGHNLEGGNDANLGQLGLDSNVEYLTQQQADKLFNLDYSDAEDSAKTIFPNLEDYPDLVQAVLTDLVFNMGLHTFKSFMRTIEAFKEGDWHKAADDLKQSDWYEETGDRAKTICNALSSM